jgi:acyl-coenzyme A thioesterase PaaI-like protein
MQPYLRIEPLKFRKESSTAISTQFTAPEHWTGWGRILHGGFQTLLLDETMSWVPFGLQGERSFVTREITVRFQRPVYVGEPIRIVGSLEEDKGREVFTRGEIRDRDGHLLTEAKGILTRLKPEVMEALLSRKESARK